MPDEHDQYTLPTLVTSKDGKTVWTQRNWDKEIRGGMNLSPRIDCTSLRLRTSEPDYTADWHVAADPTLIVVRHGQIKLILRDASDRVFGPGDAFIAADHVPDGQTFDPTLHGHRAEVVGNEPFEAIHVKLLPASE